MKTNLYDLFEQHDAVQDSFDIKTKRTDISAKNVSSAVFSELSRREAQGTTPFRQTYSVKRKVLAAALVAAMLTAITIPAYSYTSAPAYWGSYFGGNVTLLNGLYSANKTVLSTANPDISIKLRGMVGDSESCCIILDVEATGAFVFSTDAYYIPDVFDAALEDTLLNNLLIQSYSSGMSFDVTDERHMQIQLSFSAGLGSASIVGKYLELYFKDFRKTGAATAESSSESIEEAEVISGIWSGKIKLDYPDTSKKLSACGFSYDFDGVSCKLKKCRISNIGMSLSYDISGTMPETNVVSGNAQKTDEEKISPYGDLMFISDITLHYADGSEKKYAVQAAPSEDDNTLILRSSGTDYDSNRATDSVGFSFKFPKLVDADEVTAVYINGVKAFTA